MTSARICAATMAAVVMALGPHARAADGPACGTFSLYPEVATVEVFDEAPRGPSAGDRRVGSYNLDDATGRRVGRFDFVATVLPPTGTGDIALVATGVDVFATGMLTITMEYTLPAPTTSSSSPDRKLVQVVTGGSGAFAGASGTTTAVTLADGRRQMTFDLHCPQE